METLLGNVVLEHTSHTTWVVISTRPHCQVLSLIYNGHRLHSTLVNGVMCY